MTFFDITGQGKPPKTFRDAGARVVVANIERLLRCLEKNFRAIEELRV